MRINTSFQLRDNKVTAIILIATYDGKRAKISPKQSTPTKYWDKDKNAVKSSYDKSSNINAELSEQRKRLEDVFNAYFEKHNCKPEPKELQEAFKVEYFENNPIYTKEVKKTLFDVFDLYIKAMIAGGKHESANKYRPYY